MPKTPINNPMNNRGAGISPAKPQSANTQSANTVPDWWPDAARIVCALADMPETGARGFTLTGTDKNDRLDIIIWAADDGAGQTISGFVNKCPHMGLPLETFPDRFLNAAGDALICSAHGANFDAHGACFAGPCKGAHLHPLELQIENEMIILPPQKP